MSTLDCDSDRSGEDLTTRNGHILKITYGDANEIIKRLREVHLDSIGRAFVLHLNQLNEQLGARCQMKGDLLFDHLKTSFEQTFPEPNWCIKINENGFLAVILSLGEHRGALSAAELWYGAGQFLLGDVSGNLPPLSGAAADEVDCVRALPVDLTAYFDRTDARRAEPKGLPSSSGSHESGRAAESPGLTAISLRRPMPVGTLLSLGWRSYQVASTLECVFELKNLTMIGHRLSPVVGDAVAKVALDERALSRIDWNDREQIDLANIEQGLGLLLLRSPEQRKKVLIVPAAFSSLANARSRTRIVAIVTEASQRLGMKVLFEIRNLNGVPAGRIVEVISLLKPFCMTTIGHCGMDPRALTSLKGCGLGGASIGYDGARRDAIALEVHLSTISAAAKNSAGACLIHSFGSFRQVAVARLAGVTHASVKSSE